PRASSSRLLILPGRAADAPFVAVARVFSRVHAKLVEAPKAPVFNAFGPFPRVTTGVVFRSLSNNWADWLFCSQEIAACGAQRCIRGISSRPRATLFAAALSI